MAYQYVYFHGKRVSPSHATMLKAFEKQAGHEARPNQGARTIAEQTAFWLNYLRYGYPLAARPTLAAPHIKYGRQHHALDCPTWWVQALANFYRAHGVPVAFNVRGEAWHMDTLDEAALIAAAAKLGGVVLPTLKEGSRGPSVIKLKKLLYDIGKRDFSGAHSSNRYNPFFSKWTTQAVKRYQRDVNLTADGVVGPSTWHKLLTKQKG